MSPSISQKKRSIRYWFRDVGRGTEHNGYAIRHGCDHKNNVDRDLPRNNDAVTLRSVLA